MFEARRAFAAAIGFTTPQPFGTFKAALAPCDDVPHHCGLRQLCRVPICANADANAVRADRWIRTVHGGGHTQFCVHTL